MPDLNKELGEMFVTRMQDAESRLGLKGVVTMAVHEIVDGNEIDQLDMLLGTLVLYDLSFTADDAEPILKVLSQRLEVRLKYKHW